MKTFAQIPIGHIFGWDGGCSTLQKLSRDTVVVLSDSGGGFGPACFVLNKINFNRLTRTADDVDEWKDELIIEV